jgi:predicted kinase
MQMSKLIMLIGLPGSGKSYWSKKYIQENPDTILVSSDSIREEVFGDVNDQSHNGEVFNIVHQRVVAAIKNERDVILDATNLSRKRRIGFLKSIPGCLAEAIVFAIPFEFCCKRNAARDRVVPQEVMDRMYRSFQPPHYAEGFDNIWIVGAKDFDTMYIFKCEQENIKTPHDNPNHTFSCGEHCFEAELYIKNKYPNEVDLQMAARFHDVCKYKCKVFHNAKGEPTEEAHYYNHENVSAYDFIVHYFLMPPQRVIHIANLIANHMVFYAGEQAIEKRRRLYGAKFWSDLEKIHEADVAAH